MVSLSSRAFSMVATPGSVSLMPEVRPRSKILMPLSV